MIRQYTATEKDGDQVLIGTYTSQDGIERIISESRRYCSVHGVTASIGSEWEYAVIGEDDDCYGSTVAQVWVDSLEEMGDVFNPQDYTYIEEGRINF